MKLGFWNERKYEGNVLCVLQNFKAEQTWLIVALKLCHDEF